MIVATQNFEDANVLIIITLANTLVIVMLLLITVAISRDNKIHTEMV